MSSISPEADLNLISNDDPSSLPDPRINLGEVGVREDDLTSTRLERLRHKGRRPVLHPLNDGVDLPGVHLAHVLPRVLDGPVLAPVHVRHRGHKGAAGTALAPGLVKLVGRDFYLTDHVTMVRVVQSYHVPVTLIVIILTVSIAYLQPVC